MLRIAICEDTKADSALIMDYTAEYMRGTSYILETYSEGNSLLRDLKNFSFDIIFIDIMLGKINGIELAAEINIIQPQTRIIYQSVNLEFFKSVYKTEHTYFLLKPIEYKDFSKAMDKAIKSLEKTYLIIKHKDRVNLGDVLYIELINHDTVFYFKNGDFLSLRIKSKELSAQLPQGFLRCHKSFIVNIDCIKSYKTKKRFTVENGQTIPIGNKYSDEVNDRIIHYWRDSIL